MIYLLIAFIALQIADGLTTYLVISKGGREKNPIVAWGMKQIGLIPALVAYKALAIGAGFVLYHFADDGGLYVLIAMVALYGWVVAQNWRAYHQLSTPRADGTLRAKE